MTLSSKHDLDIAALKIRLGIIRAVSANHGGHVGGSMDLAEMMAVVYSDFMRIDVQNPSAPDRDYMIFSKGHAGPALYSTLALKKVISYELLDNLNNVNSKLPGHCDRNKVPGVDATTGSLGQGLSIACGVALASKTKGTDQRIFCVTGDGESAEGQIWEAAQFAAHYRLDNLIAFLDWNGKQIDGTNDQVLSLGDIVSKYAAFGWNSVCVQGDDVLAIQDAIQKVISNPNGRPSMIILKTTKGRGAKCLESMENNHCIGFSEALKEEVMSELNVQAQMLGVEVCL